MAFVANDAEEVHFYNLFTAVLENLIAYENGQENIIQEQNIYAAILKIIDSFRQKIRNHYREVDYGQPVNRIAYLFRYGTHGACLARNRVLNALSNCTTFKDCFMNGNIRNIISLGGGPGNDIVGLCSALNDIQCFSSLKLTVVDRIQPWAQCINLVDGLLRTGAYGSASNTFLQPDTNLSFIQADLTGNVHENQEYIISLMEADVIVMQKLLSTMQPIEKVAVIQSLIAYVKPGAFLLYIDSPFSIFSSNFELLYLPQSVLPDYMRTNTVQRYGSDDAVSSKTQVAVLRKR